jgi:hypothetical protein
MPTYLCIIYGFFLVTVGELSSPDRHCLAHKTKTIYSLDLYRAQFVVVCSKTWVLTKQHNSWSQCWNVDLEVPQQPIEKSWVGGRELSIHLE